jgi:hypothetical protein
MLSSIPIGGTKEWMTAFGAEDSHIGEALNKVRQSNAYRKLKSLGFTDESSDRQKKLGSITFVMGYAEPASPGKQYARKWKVTIQANGKIDEYSQSEQSRAPIASGKPRIVPGAPVQSIQKSMEAAMEKLAVTAERRTAAWKKAMDKHMKAGK